MNKTHPLSCRSLHTTGLVAMSDVQSRTLGVGPEGWVGSSVGAREVCEQVYPEGRYLESLPREDDT